jgi:hypothetical protein
MSLILILGLVAVISWALATDKLMPKIRAKARELADRWDQKIKDLENQD